jgi:hypothetical protein
MTNLLKERELLLKKLDENTAKTKKEFVVKVSEIFDVDILLNLPCQMSFSNDSISFKYSIPSSIKKEIASLAESYGRQNTSALIEVDGYRLRVPTYHDRLTLEIPYEKYSEAVEKFNPVIDNSLLEIFSKNINIKQRDIEYHKKLIENSKKQIEFYKALISKTV